MWTSKWIPLAFSAVYFSPQSVEADVAKFSMVLVMSETHCCSEKVILESLIYGSWDSSLLPIVGPEVNLAQISWVLQRGGVEHRCRFPLEKSISLSLYIYISVHNCPSKIGEGILLYSIVELLHQWTQKFKEFDSLAYAIESVFWVGWTG